MLQEEDWCAMCEWCQLHIFSYFQFPKWISQCVLHSHRVRRRGISFAKTGLSFAYFFHFSFARYPQRNEHVNVFSFAKRKIQTILCEQKTKPHSSGVAFAISLLPWIFFFVVRRCWAATLRTPDEDELQWDEKQHLHVKMLLNSLIHSAQLFLFHILRKNGGRTTKIFMTIQSTFATGKIVWWKCSSIGWLALSLIGQSLCLRERYDGSAVCHSEATVGPEHTHEHWTNVVRYPLSNVVCVCAILPFRAGALCIHYLPPHNPFCVASMFCKISWHRLQCVFCSRYQPTDLNSLLLLYFSFFYFVTIEICVNKLSQPGESVRQRQAMRCNRPAVACLT